MSENQSSGSKFKDEIFDLYEKSIAKADWGYKVKKGDERDIGHRSVVLAEKSFIMAGQEDKERAMKIWEKATGKPPKQELMDRLSKASQIDYTKGISNLTSGISSLEARKNLFDLDQSSKEIKANIEKWQDKLKHEREKASNARQKGLANLLSAEKLDHGDDSGLSLLSKSIKNGFSAGGDISKWYVQRKIEKLEKKGFQAELGSVRQKEAEFIQARVNPGSQTNGMLGKQLKKYPGVSKFVVAAMAMMKPKSPEKGTSSILQGEAAKQASMAASQNAGMGI
jgi:hypothetical protein